MVLKNLFTGQREKDTENRLMDLGRREERVRCTERVTWKLTICEIDGQREFAVWLWKLKQGLCINLDGWDGEGEGGVNRGQHGNIHIAVRETDSRWEFAV